MLFNNKMRSRLLNAIWYNRKVIKSINMRRKQKGLIILHAASAGEFEQLVPILKCINRQNFFILVSFMSPTIFSKQWDTKFYSRENSSN